MLAIFSSGRSMCPPSITSSWPGTRRDSSEASQSTPSLVASGGASRRHSVGHTPCRRTPCCPWCPVRDRQPSGPAALPVQDRRSDETGQHRVAADAMRSEFERHSLHRAENAVLGADVVRVVRPRLLAVHRRDNDHGTGAALDHVRSHRLQGAHRTEQIDVDNGQSAAVRCSRPANAMKPGSQQTE